MKKHLIFILALAAVFTVGVCARRPVKEPLRRMKAIETCSVAEIEEAEETEKDIPAETEAEIEPETAGETEPQTEPEDLWKPAKEDISIIAQVLYHECRALPKLEQSAVVWVVLNRVDSDLFYFPDTIVEVCTQKNQFAYRKDAPVLDELCDIAEDVLIRHHREANGDEKAGRTLPPEYTYFWGDGRHNYFRTDYRSHDYWDWSLPNPYGD